MGVGEGVGRVCVRVYECVYQGKVIYIKKMRSHHPDETRGIDIFAY